VIKKKIKKTKVYYKYFIYGLAIFATILFLIISKHIRVAIIVTIFILLNRLITTYKLFIRLPIEFEFLTLGIVISTLSFGSKAGLVIAIFGCIISFIIGFEFSTFSLPMFLGYSSVAIITYLLQDYNITFVGIFATLINNLIVFSLYHYVFGYDLGRNISFSTSNIIFNSVLFFNIAPFLMTII